MNTARYIPRYTYNDYKHWDEDWEMIDGVPISIKPHNGATHQILLNYLSIGLNNSLKENCPDFIVIHTLDWIVDDYTVVRPDISVILSYM